MLILNADELKKKFEERQAILNIPAAEVAIWRYYSLDKFLSLITSGSLFFSPASSCEDPFEGDYGEQAKEQIRLQYGDGQYLRDFNTYDFLRHHTYISCWHESEHESDGMWKLYGNGIAVKARFGNIQKLLKWSETEVKHAGRVNYIDYSVDHVNVGASYLPYFFKRKSFSHEHEVRFLIQEHRYDWNEYPKPSPGKTAALDLNSDIEELVLSPIMAPFICAAVERVIQQAGITVPVRRSVLLNRPIWC
ncbi:MAG: hypothetical protein Q8K12_14695 [Thiobacillus sp.]|nr:hypothetical protein [Thiobacillus sp.]